MEDTKNPLLCDPSTGVCEIPERELSPNTDNIRVEKAPVTIVYFTDPICSACWGIEPQLRKLKLEYADQVKIEYRMGGLLPDWSYNSGGISKPSDVAHHWDEAAAYYKMPIDGGVWLEDPLSSSYPPSIAFKAAQLQDEIKAVSFLRILREMLFIEKKNITKWEHVALAANQAGLDSVALKRDTEGQAKTLFVADLNASRQYGVRGFPTLFVTNASGAYEILYGFKPYSAYESAIKRIYPEVKKHTYNKEWNNLFNVYPTLATREFAELSGLSMQQSEELLQGLADQGLLVKHTIKSGTLWEQKDKL